MDGPTLEEGRRTRAKDGQLLAARLGFAIVFVGSIFMACRTPPSFHATIEASCSTKPGRCTIEMADLVPGEWDTLWVGNHVHEGMFPKELGLNEAPILIREAGESESRNLVMLTRGDTVVWKDWCRPQKDTDDGCVFAPFETRGGWLRLPRERAVLSVGHRGHAFILSAAVEGRLQDRPGGVATGDARFSTLNSPATSATTDLCALSDSILVATVDSRESWQQMGEIGTTVGLVVDRTIVGPRKPAVELVVRGGTYAGLTSHVSHEPRMSIGTTWLLFLRSREGQVRPDHVAGHVIPESYKSLLPGEKALRDAWTLLCRRHPEGVSYFAAIPSAELLEVAAESGIDLPDDVGPFFFSWAE